MKRFMTMTILLACGMVLGANALKSIPGGEFGVWTASIGTENKIGAVTLKGQGFRASDSVKVDFTKFYRISVDKLQLNAGKKYRFGAYVRTKNLRARVAAFIISTHNWTRDVRTRQLPANTDGKWVKVEYTAALPPSSNGKYSFMLYTNKVTGGEVEVSAPFVVDVEAEANRTGNLLEDYAYPPFGVWSDFAAARKINPQISKGEGFNGSDAVKFDFSKFTTLGIPGVKLVAGQKYRFGVYVRTNNLRARTATVIVYNNYWRRDVRAGTLPRNTASRWIKVETTAVVPKSSNGQYTFMIYINKPAPGSELEVSAPFIEKATESAPAAPPQAKVKAPGGNVLPGFAPSADGALGLWSRNINATKPGRITIRRGAGFNGADALQIKGGFSLGDIPLVGGETYRFGAYVRTKNLNNTGSRIVISNYKWSSDVSSAALPQNTNGQWVKVEQVAKIPASRNKRYSFIFYVPSNGEYEMSSPFIEGVSQRAKDETFPAVSYLNNIRRIFPVTPVLTQIEAAKPEITFSYVCPLPEKESAYFLQVRIAEKGKAWPAWQKFDVPADRMIKVAWQGKLNPGKGRIQVELRKRADNSLVLSSEYNSVRFLAPLPPVQQKRLNNLVVEIGRHKLADGKFSFVNPRAGWVYIGFPANELRAKAVLNGVEIITPRKDERSETMRYLPRGKYEFTVSGVSTTGGEIVIRTVPEIILFPMEVYEKNDFAKFHYDYDFLRKHFWHSINVYFMLHGWNPKTDFMRRMGDEVFARGIRRMGSDGFNAPQWMNKELMVEDIASSHRTHSTQGRAVDETASSESAIALNNYAESCWEFPEFDKFIYLWLANTEGYLAYPPIHAPLMSGASHIGFGRGKLLMETYVETTPDLESLKRYYTLVRKHMIHGKKLSPDAPQRMILVMSGLLLNGAWNCNAYPQSDIKYALDYFYHLVATEPEARDLYGVGCYNLHYSDEELARWIGLLMRHYCVEGKTEMLSPKYGIVYNPGHVVNGDFVNGTDGWKVTPAKGGSMRPRTINGYGFTKQRRRGVGSHTGNGNTVLEIVRSASGPNVLEQTFKNFEVGKLYSLSYVTANGDDITKRRNVRYNPYLEAELQGAEIIPELGYFFSNPPGSKVHRNVINTRKIVFRALKPEIRVIFRDWQSPGTMGGKAGDRTWLNFINVNRYFPAQ